MKSTLPEAVIFDMDGVLIDSEPFWSEAEFTVFNKYGIRISLEETNETMGIRLPDVVAMRKKQFPEVTAKNELIVNETISEVIRLIKEKGKCIDGIPLLLESLKNAKIPIGLATSSSPDIIEAVLEKLQIAHYFEAVASAANEKNGKPFPDVFFTAAKKLGVNPENCLVFEDSPKGVEAANKAGMKVIALNSNNLPEESFKTIVKHLYLLSELGENPVASIYTMLN